jgi:hypothetical protein
VTRAVVAVALALAAACSSGEARSTALPGAASATNPPAPAPPRCHVDAAAIPPLPAFEPVPGERPRLTVEVVESPAVGRCVRADELLGGPATEADTVGALRGSGADRTFALHRVRDVALLGEGPFFLAADAAGVYLHDVATLGRRARLHESAATAVASSPDGTIAAALLERPRIADGEATRHTLLVFESATLAIVAEVDRAPAGRLRFSPDGRRLVLASEERALWVYDLDTSSLLRRRVDEPIADAAFVPDRPGIVATVGDTNEVRFHDVANDRAIAQSGGATLKTSRDLNALAVIGEAGWLVAGGDDDRLHVYRGMLGERAEEVRSVELDGNVEDIACCRGARFAVGTNRGSITWFDRDERTRTFGPLVPNLLGDPMRLALHGDGEVLAAFLGQLFRWDGGDLVVAAPCAAGDLIASDASDEDVLVVLRVGANLAIHRVVGESRPEASTEEVGKVPWADVTRIVRAEGGARAILGLDRDGVQVAFVDPLEGLTTAVGPGMRLSARFELAEVEPGRYALWDGAGMVYELDVPTKTWRLVGRVEEPADGMRIARHPRRGYEARFEGSRRRAAIASAVTSP